VKLLKQQVKNYEFVGVMTGRDSNASRASNMSTSGIDMDPPVSFIIASIHNLVIVIVAAAAASFTASLSRGDKIVCLVPIC